MKNQENMTKSAQTVLFSPDNQAQNNQAQIAAIRAVFAPKLLTWYRENRRDLPWRHTRDPYKIWISEIMLQQTRVDTVLGYYERFLRVFPDVRALADADPEKLLKLWEGLGYYSRARNLQKTARIVAGEFGGEFPRRRSALLRLPGIGAYTAGAIASIAFGLPEPAVDGNVLRVVSRVFGSSACVDLPETKNAAEDFLRTFYDRENCGDFTQSLMELGATVCLPNGKPLCADCPLCDECAARASGTTDRLPVRKEKTPKKTRYLTVFVLTCGETIALDKRPDDGLLAGLWELPNTEGPLSPEQAYDYAARRNWHPAGPPEAIAQTRHVFTHIVWEMTVCRLRCAQPPAGLTPAGVPELRDTYSLPTAFRRCLDALNP